MPRLSPPHAAPLAALLVPLLAAPAAADVTIADVFGDHMVLQAGVKAPVFGTTEPGGEVAVLIGETISIGMEDGVRVGETVSYDAFPTPDRATADENGRWQVEIGPIEPGRNFQLLILDADEEKVPADTDGLEFVPKVESSISDTPTNISDTPTKIILTDVLAGDVWLCSGQSNMEWQLKNTLDADREIKAAKDEEIRLFTVLKHSAPEPQTELKEPGGKDEPSAARWVKLSPEAAAEFSAVGYYFGREIHEATGRPVGLVNSSWGGTPSEAWTREPTLETVPEAKGTLQRWAEIDRKFAAGEEVPKNWSGKFSPTHPHHPGNLNNGMIAPLAPLALKGAIWYQGESNASRAEQYDEIFPAMIEDWRDQFGQEIPFFWVQLANFQQYDEDPNAYTNWAELREAQDRTLDELEAVGQAVILDVGEADDIHPRNKKDVGERLALAALREVYEVNEPGMLSPRVKDVALNGKTATVTFDVDGDRLQVRRDESVGADDAAPGAVLGFTVAGPGDDAPFVRAEARVTGPDTVEVTAPDGVDEIAAVRYAWAQNPRVTLFNTRGLPASPFRTDDRERVTAGAR